MFLFWTQIVRVLETVLDWLLKSNVRCSRDISVLLMPSNRFAISCLQSLLTSITYYPNTNYIKIALTHVLTRFGLLLFNSTRNTRTSYSNITVGDIKITLNFFDQESI